MSLLLISESGGPFIDQILVLQSYAEGWTDGKWEEKVDERPCIEKLMYSKDKQGYYRYCFIITGSASSGAVDKQTYRQVQGMFMQLLKPYMNSERNSAHKIPTHVIPNWYAVYFFLWKKVKILKELFYI